MLNFHVLLHEARPNILFLSLADMQTDAQPEEGGESEGDEGDDDEMEDEERGYESSVHSEESVYENDEAYRHHADDDECNSHSP